jgi:predicted alternative tryptophan synthase beta-subunit
MPDDRTTIYLDESRVPHQWYNVIAIFRRHLPRR